MTTIEPAPYSLGLRMSWLFAVQTLLGLGIVSACIYAVMAFDLARKADMELARKTELVRHLVSEAARSGDVPTLRHKLDEFFQVHEDLRVTLLNAAGQAVYASPGAPQPAPMQREAVFDLPKIPLTNLISGRITMNRSYDGQLLVELAAALVVATLLGALVVSAAGFWMVRRSLAPLRGLAQQTSSLRAIQLGQQLRLERPVKELQPWIDQFNLLLGRLDYAYRQLESFSADVAHELRTPLTTLIGQTEVELARERGAGELRDTLAANLEELRRLSSIVNDMLFLSRADHGAKAAAGTLGSLASEAQQVLEFHEGTLAEKALVARVIGDASVPMDRGLVRRGISNLLSNAIRHAEPGSELKVIVRQSANEASIFVENVGDEVAPDALPRLFDRFFRVQGSREGGGENNGLGLAIVAAIARMHGGHPHAASGNGITSVGFTLSGQLAATPEEPRPARVRGRTSAAASAGQPR